MDKNVNVTGRKMSKILSFVLLFCAICTMLCMPVCAEDIPAQTPAFRIDNLWVGGGDVSVYNNITQYFPVDSDMYVYGTCAIEGLVPTGDWEGNEFVVSSIENIAGQSIPIGYIVLYYAGEEPLGKDYFDAAYEDGRFDVIGDVYEVFASSDLLSIHRTPGQYVAWYSPGELDDRGNLGYGFITLRGYSYTVSIQTDAQQWQLEQSYNDGYQAGKEYQAGLQSVPHTWTDFFRGIIEAPVHAVASVFDFSVGGVAIVDAFVTVALILVCLFVIGKLWEAIRG